jgi:hypothetical protein
MKINEFVQRTGIGAPADHKIKRREENGVNGSRQKQG